MTTEVRRILIVDDQAFLASTMAQALGGAGFEVRIVGTGEAAVHYLEGSEPPDLVVLKVELPDLSGDAICSEMRGSPELARIPVLLVSDLPEFELETLAAESGADGWMHRPFSPLSVLVWIHEHPHLFRSPETMPPMPPAREEAASDRVPILVVEDDPRIREMVRDTFADEGYRVDTASDWPSFRDRMLSDRYTVVVLDLGLPNLSGDKLALFAQAFLEPPKPRFVIHSGMTEAEIGAAAERIGAAGWVRKGADLGRLVKLVAEAAAATA